MRARGQEIEEEKENDFAGNHESERNRSRKLEWWCGNYQMIFFITQNEICLINPFVVWQWVVKSVEIWNHKV